jgi:hypothetical protein
MHAAISAVAQGADLRATNVAIGTLTRPWPPAVRASAVLRDPLATIGSSPDSSPLMLMRGCGLAPR